MGRLAVGRARCAGPGKAEPRSGRAAGSAAPCLPLIARPSPSGVVARQAREELKAKDANCQSLTEDLVDTATRERSLESQLARLGGVEVQAGAQAEQVEHGKDASAPSVAEELAQARAAIEEHKSAASHWMRSCKQVQADAQKQGAELAARNTALRSLGAQLLQLREELGVERQASAQLQAKMQEMSGDADGYQQTISVLQAASHIPCRYCADTMQMPYRSIQAQNRACGSRAHASPCRWPCAARGVARRAHVLTAAAAQVLRRRRRREMQPEVCV